jgi:hypothetical protein
MAFPLVSARYPHPSSTVSTIGFGRFAIARQNTRNRLSLSCRIRVSARFDARRQKTNPAPVLSSS